MKCLLQIFIDVFVFVETKFDLKDWIPIEEHILETNAGKQLSSAATDI
jgi:hypothetical protein